LEKNNFKALLAEYVQSGDAFQKFDEFSDFIKEKGDRRIDTQVLSERDLEDMFYSRLDSLRSHKDRDFERMLMESNIDITTKYEIVKDTLSKDPRFTSMKESQREDLFNRYLKDIKRKAESDFIFMLRDFPKLNGNIKSENEKEFSVIVSMLRGDSRWKRLDCMPYRRIELYDQFIDKLRDDPDSIIKRRRDELRRDR